jgi:hypothetical protein
MNRRLETPEELVSGMADRPPGDALLYFVDWLNRRDRLSEKVATEHLAASLEALAAELRAQAVRNLSTQTRGLILAATVLLDAAGEIRAGDGSAHEPLSRRAGDAPRSIARDDRSTKGYERSPAVRLVATACSKPYIGCLQGLPRLAGALALTG